MSRIRGLEEMIVFGSALANGIFLGALQANGTNVQPETLAFPVVAGLVIGGDTNHWQGFDTGVGGIYAGVTLTSTAVGMAIGYGVGYLFTP